MDTMSKQLLADFGLTEASSLPQEIVANLNQIDRIDARLSEIEGLSDDQVTDEIREEQDALSEQLGGLTIATERQLAAWKKMQSSNEPPAQGQTQGGQQAAPNAGGQNQAPKKKRGAVIFAVVLGVLTLGALTMGKNQD